MEHIFPFETEAIIKLTNEQIIGKKDKYTLW